MDFTDLLRVLWQRRVVAGLVFIATVALGLGVLAVQTPVYRATSTLTLLPQAADGNADPVFIISQIDVITPMYAAAAETRETKVQARQALGGELGEVSVRTFRGAPILKIEAESTDPELARRSAQAVTEVLLDRATRGEVGLPDVLRLSQIDPPFTPTEPVRPQPRLVLAVAILLGLGGGIGAAVVRENLARRVDSVEVLTATTGLPVFAEIPAHRGIEKVRSPAHLVTDPEHREVAEALRDIRTNLQFTDPGVRSILVTSPEGRHGKTTIAAGLAATMARAGARTVLVDADLRRGRLAEMLDVPRAPGLVEVLEGLPARDAVIRSDLDGLDLLPGGALPDDPSELLEQAFFQVLYDLEAAYDVVVIDATPLVPVNDARLIARYTSSVILVTQADQVTRRQVKAAVERLELIGVTARAAVLNQSKVKRRASYYRYLRPADEARRPVREASSS